MLTQEILHLDHSDILTLMSQNQENYTFLPIPGVKYQALTQPLTLRCWDYSKNGDLM